MAGEQVESIRWMCTHHQPPVLLAVLTGDQELHIKVGARNWRVSGFEQVIATCPKCGAETTLIPEPQRAMDIPGKESTWHTNHIHQEK